MIRFNFQNIETVVCISRLGTYSAAADYLHTTQPAISARVKELERSLGMAIFEKRGRQVQLTAAGRLLVEKFEPLIGKVQQVYFDFKEQSAQIGRLRVGMRDVCVPWFGQLLSNVHESMPTVTYEVEVDIAVNLVKKVEDGRLDCAIIPGVIDRPGVRCAKLGYFRTTWVMASDRFHRHAANESPRDISGFLNCGPIWMMPRNSTFYDRQLEVLKAHGALLNNISTCSNTTSLIQMISATGGLGCVPQLMANEAIARGQLLPVAPELRPVETVYAVAYRDSRVDPVLESTVALLVDKHGLPTMPPPDALVWDGFYR